MLKPIYSPLQLGMMIHKTLENHKKELSKPVVPTIKEIWMRESSLKMLNTLEQELKNIKKSHPEIRITIKDITETIGMALDVFMKEVNIKKN